MTQNKTKNPDKPTQTVTFYNVPSENIWLLKDLIFQFRDAHNMSAEIPISQRKAKTEVFINMLRDAFSKRHGGEEALTNSLRQYHKIQTHRQCNHRDEPS